MQDDGQAAAFHEDGFTRTPLTAFSEEQAAVYLRQLEEYERAVGGQVKGEARFQTHLILPWVAEIACCPTLVGAAARALGSEDLLVWFTEWHIKEPRSSGHYTWHQDSAYAGLSPPEHVVTAWVALTEADRRNGCVEFMPGTHLGGPKLHLERPSSTNLLMLGQYIPDDQLDLGHATPVELRPGQATLHAFRCVHASGPNQDPCRRRIGLAIRYMTPDVRQEGPFREGAMLVMGRDRCGHFDLRRRPTCVMSAEDMAVHREEMAVMEKNYVEGQRRGRMRGEEEEAGAASEGGS